MLNKTSADLGLKTGTVDLATEFGPKTTPTKTSRVILGYQGGGKAVGEIRSNGFPLGQTQFTDVYGTDGNKLVWTEDAVESGSSTWINGSHRQSYSYQAGVDNGGEVSSPTGPDEVELSTFPFDNPTAIAGPIMAHLNVSSTAPDTELFVQLLDRGPDGTLLYLNRGMLRTSHDQIDEAESQKTADGQIYRPYRPHELRDDVPIGEERQYLIDVFPVGHVFLPGHELVVKVHAPPADDNDYNYNQKTLPGQNTLNFGPGKTRLTLPVVPMGQVRGFQAPVGQCPYADMRCLPGS
jgi:predicted acyl esterase